jgi:hypothetical protein
LLLESLEWKESIIVLSIRRVIKRIVVILEGCHRSTTVHIFCIHQILEEIWEFNKAVHQLFIDFKKAYVSVRREVLYNIVIEFGIPLKQVRLINKCLKCTAESG